MIQYCKLPFGVDRRCIELRNSKVKVTGKEELLKEVERFYQELYDTIPNILVNSIGISKIVYSATVLDIKKDCTIKTGSLSFKSISKEEKKKFKRQSFASSR